MPSRRCRDSALLQCIRGLKGSEVQSTMHRFLSPFTTGMPHPMLLRCGGGQRCLGGSLCGADLPERPGEMG